MFLQLVVEGPRGEECPTLLPGVSGHCCTVFVTKSNGDLSEHLGNVGHVRLFDGRPFFKLGVEDGAFGWRVACYDIEVSQEALAPEVAR